MKAVAVMFLLIASLPSPLANAAAIWDALPAIEPEHLKGPYAGKRVCPMCSHGYDAGIMVFLPDSLSLDAARPMIANLATLTRGIPNSRFRIFIVVAGNPSTALLSVLNVDDPRWFAASLSSEALAKAERDMNESLRGAPRGFVFVQRRLLHVLSLEAMAGEHTEELHSQTQYALELLNILHPVSIPNSPQGAMWFAPAKLHSSIELSGQRGSARRICLVATDGSRLSNALVQFNGDDESYRWARTDAQGCVVINGTQRRGSIPFAVFANMRSTNYGTLIATQLATTAVENVVRVADAVPRSNERVVGLPCENCDNVFVAMPTTLASNARIAPIDEPGEPMRLSGRTLDGTGKPVAGVIVYAYQTNQKGIYSVSDDAAPRMKLRGWAQSDEQGRYSFDTIRPGSYPDRLDAAHIHLHIIEVGRCTYYIDNVVFDDDPRLKNDPSKPTLRGGTGLTAPRKDAKGIWQVTRDIHLGRNVPGYQQCAGGDDRLRAAI